MRATHLQIGTSIPPRLNNATQQLRRLEAVGLMTAGLAHDLANSVQTLTSAGNILRRHPALACAADLQPALEGAGTALRHIDAMVTALLGFARAQPDEQLPFDPAQCICEIEPLLRWSIAANVVLSIHLEPNMPQLGCSRHQMESAILNLVRNANDAIDGGGLIVVAASTDHDRRHIIVEVADSGIGMSKSTCARAFEPFFTTRGAGTGLGLAMVHRFARNHKGHVSIESEPGGGTNVQLQLPAEAEDSPQFGGKGSKCRSRTG